MHSLIYSSCVDAPALVLFKEEDLVQLLQSGAMHGAKVLQSGVLLPVRLALANKLA